MPDDNPVFSSREERGSNDVGINVGNRKKSDMGRLGIGRWVGDMVRKWWAAEKAVAQVLENLA